MQKSSLKGIWKWFFHSAVLLYCNLVYCTVSKVLFYPVIFIINQQDVCCHHCHIDLCWWISHGSSLYQWLMSHFLHSPFPWIFRTSNAPHHKDTSSWNAPMYNITDSYFQKHCIKAVIDCLWCIKWHKSKSIMIKLTLSSWSLLVHTWQLNVWDIWLVLLWKDIQSEC